MPNTTKTRGQKIVEEWMRDCHYIDVDEPDPDLASRIDAELAKKRTLDLSEDAATLGEWIEDIECDNTEILVKLSTIRAQLPDIEVKT